TSRPRQWKLKSTISRSHDVEDRESPAALHHSRHFPENSRLVLNIHSDVNHVRAIKSTRWKRHLQRASLLELCLPIQVQHPRQTLSYLHEFFGQIQPRHLTSLLSEIARRTAHSAPDIE